MEETVCSLACRNRKRKFQTELLGPFAKHVRSVQGVEYDSSPDSSKDLNEDIKVFTSGSESDPESTKDNNNFHADEDCYMSEYYEANKTNIKYPKTYVSDEPSTSTCSNIDLYSLESRSLMTSSCSKSESVCISEKYDYPIHGYMFLPSLNYEEHLTEFENHDEDCCSSEYRNDDNCCTGKEIEIFLRSSGVSSNEYVLSSGRWSVNHDNQQGAQKLTIDKEFEHYFSTLML